MKKTLFKYLLAFSLFLGISQFTHAQTRVYVKVRPRATVVARPAAPHRGYVWVGDEWTPGNGTYTHVDGRWVAPRRGYIWVAGRWAHEGRGYYWVAGHWRRR